MNDHPPSGDIKPNIRLSYGHCAEYFRYIYTPRRGAPISRTFFGRAARLRTTYRINLIVSKLVRCHESRPSGGAT
eukprot:scaffold46018_cov34-Prasinocladus_malaysianus.AAC.2